MPRGIEPYPAGFSTRTIRFKVPGSGRIAFFGHLSIELQRAGAEIPAGARYEPGLEVDDQLAAAVRDYHARYGRQRGRSRWSTCSTPRPRRL